MATFPHEMDRLKVTKDKRRNNVSNRVIRAVKVFNCPCNHMYVQKPSHIFTHKKSRMGERVRQFQREKKKKERKKE